MNSCFPKTLGTSAKAPVGERLESSDGCGRLKAPNRNNLFQPHVTELIVDFQTNLGRTYSPANVDSAEIQIEQLRSESVAVFLTHEEIPKVPKEVDLMGQSARRDFVKRIVGIGTLKLGDLPQMLVASCIPTLEGTRLRRGCNASRGG
jgi:hypothetical protein